MKQETLTRAFEVIMQIYDNSMYDSDTDLFRIKDVANAFVGGQLQSKEWLVDEVLKFRDSENLHSGYSFFIIGGWYGVLAQMFKERDESFITVSVDMDPICEKIGYQLFPNVIFKTDEAHEVLIDTQQDHSWMINTSCEHMEQEDLDLLTGNKAEHTYVCMQSNNMFHEPSHINCHETLEDFANSLMINEILEKFEIDMGNGYKRFMVIGR
jgi:hypothetical protein